jgi:decaprenylphospho-beta-D-ribofuranose 2-oxidase
MVKSLYMQQSHTYKEKEMKIKLLLFIGVTIYIGLFTFSYFSTPTTNTTLTLTDVSRLMPVKVEKVVKGQEEKQIHEVILEANENNLKVAIAGKRHSMGGHTFYKDAVVLDMTSYNKILDFNKENKTITVQSGATWDDIQRHVNPHGLAVKVMQSQNIFTIGGSLSVNAHGRDIRYGSLIDSVISFRLMNASGEIITVSREENEELFYLVIGGYGLFGVILDVELSLTNDEVYVMETDALTYEQFPEYFKENVIKNDKVRMHLSRISTAPNSFLTEMYATNYVLADENEQLNISKYNELKEDSFTFLTKFTLGLSRDSDWGKNTFWDMQKNYFLKENGTIITRNNVMRSESKFLEYEDESTTDVLQEYFVPIDEFPSYIDDLRVALNDEKKFNLFNITIRYVQKDEDAVLSYARDDMFALVLLINQGLSKDEQKKAAIVMQKMIDVTLKHHGTYYLPYMPYPTKKQMQNAYPRTDEFFDKKLLYDPNELFMNYFYERYK